MSSSLLLLVVLPVGQGYVLGVLDSPVCCKSLRTALCAVSYSADEAFVRCCVFAGRSRACPVASEGEAVDGSVENECFRFIPTAVCWPRCWPAGVVSF